MASPVGADGGTAFSVMVGWVEMKAARWSGTPAKERESARLVQTRGHAMA